MHQHISTAFLTMQIVKMAKAMIPTFHATMDEDKMYHLGCTWISEDGLTDRHNVEIRYIRNSESLALKGEPQPDGSWKYVEPNGAEHVMTAERVKWFMQQTHRQALVMNQMLTKLEQSGTATEVIDALTAPA